MHLNICGSHMLGLPISIYVPIMHLEMVVKQLPYMQGISHIQLYRGIGSRGASMLVHSYIIVELDVLGALVLKSHSHASAMLWFNVSHNIHFPATNVMLLQVNITAWMHVTLASGTVQKLAT